ncbi:MAG: SEL1-like repeat protein [Phenylobacterium sp.]|uniref:caspase family protein n=1 Tax=Phenylobacterium sp. TaxID=1871053 RepID=UPI001A44D0B7|nr:caspase family protein [Phenylobacterium sp.]MBL8556276.1 SEL1-like repeat protein [Phenylobacterium sp.]
MRRATAERPRSARRWQAVVVAVALNVVVVPGAWAAQRVALIVSVSKYDKVPSLANPAKDAKLVQATLQKLGFTVKVLNDPSRLQLIEGLGAFEEDAKGSEAAVVYYAGHGAMIDGVNYLLPKDAISTNKSTLTASSVESALLGQSLMGAKAVRLIILDACRNNPTATRSLGGNTRGLAREAGPTSVAVVTLMAAGPGQVAQDGAAGAANSPFAIALTQGMTRPGITVGELPSYVQAEVERMTEGEQTPDLQGIWPNVHWSFDPNGPAKQASAAPAADVTKIKWEKDQVFWTSIKDSDDPADFKAYMDAQDRGEISGSFRKLASNRIRALEKLPAGSFQVASRSAAPGQELVGAARDAFARGDYKAAFRDWSTAAGQGNGAAMYNLGVMSLTGKGAPKDVNAAARWFKSSADAGHSGGMVNWALCQLNGFGAARNEGAGFQTLQRAADRGSATAMGMLAEAYLRGRGAAQDPRQAAGWLQKAVDAGDGPSIAQLGDLYERGVGVPKDGRRAFTLYQRAAVAGDTDAMVRLGYAYEDGEAVAKDDVQAATWYQRAAEAGNSEGMSSLAVMFENGAGLTQDYGRAADYYRQAANAGDARGYLGLGSLTARGAGVRANTAEAVKLFQQAADRGSAAAMRNLGIMYEGGQGVAANRARAVEWYRKAVAAGDQGAQGELDRLGAR